MLQFQNIRKLNEAVKQARAEAKQEAEGSPCIFARGTKRLRTLRNLTDTNSTQNPHRTQKHDTQRID